MYQFTHALAVENLSRLPVRVRVYQNPLVSAVIVARSRLIVQFD
jgi:hypothetical protein